MKKQLMGKKALVTGAGTGLGRAIALELARKGSEVCIHYASSKNGAENVVGEIRNMGGTAYILKADLRDATQAKELVNSAIELMDGLDILVNNAGLSNTMRFLNVSQSDYDELFNLNMRGTFFCAQSAVEHMQKQKNGVIINLSSAHGISSLPGYSIYAATKGAIISFTKQLAVELAGIGIRVNCIVPGCILVESDLAKNPDLSVTEIGKTIPCGYVGDPAEIGYMAAFLAGDESKYITGTVHVVDGGLLSALALSTPEAVY